MIDLGLIAGYVLVGLCTIAAVVMPLVQSLSDPKSLAKSGIGVGVLVVIFLISYDSRLSILSFLLSLIPLPLTLNPKP